MFSLTLCFFFLLVIVIFIKIVFIRLGRGLHLINFWIDYSFTLSNFYSGFMMLSMEYLSSVVISINRNIIDNLSFNRCNDKILNGSISVVFKFKKESSVKDDLIIIIISCFYIFKPWFLKFFQGFLFKLVKILIFLNQSEFTSRKSQAILINDGPNVHVRINKRNNSWESYFIRVRPHYVSNVVA